MQQGGIAHLAFYAFVVSALALKEEQSVGRDAASCPRHGRGVTRTEGDASGAGCREAEHDHVVGQRSERLAHIVHSARGEASGGYGAVKVELTVVIGIAAKALEVEMQRPHGLVRHAVGTRRANGRSAEFLSLQILSFEKKPPYLRQGILRLRVRVVVGRTSPHGFFVELELVVRRVAKDHRSEPSVAQG